MFKLDLNFLLLLFQFQLSFFSPFLPRFYPIMQNERQQRRLRRRERQPRGSWTPSTRTFPR